MHVGQFLHKLLFKSLSQIHKTRLLALYQTVLSLIDNGQLTLTLLGRNMQGRSRVKHKIKKVDRLLGNKNLYNEQFLIYKNLSQRLFKHLTDAVIIVDWSGCCSQQRWILQASLVCSGRSIPIYKELHLLKKISNPKVEKAFLKRLSIIIPKHISVILVTDAGFKTPWFKAVRGFGWDFVGRVRKPIQLNFIAGLWVKVSQLSNIKATPLYLGEALVGKTKGDFKSFIYGVRPKLHGRKMKKKKYHCDMYPDKQDKYSRVHREPWVLATSLEGGKQIARRIINIYKSRMQIEQNFRDDKNQRWGFALRYSRTENIKRLEIMMLIAFIAIYMLCLLGLMAEARKLQFQYQANTRKDVRVLSITSLAKQLIRHGQDHFCWKDLNLVLIKMAEFQRLTT